ncbi:MAG: hypothetical protein U9M96_01730 [Thermodesulfobacteriota bacterium]|nr:hypothetical protein [Thermodesulfobacteriota bacterium]
MMDIQGLVTRILERRGCLVEATVDDAVRILFPRELQRALSVGEMKTFTFQGGEGNHYESDFIDSLGSLVSSRGLFAAVSLPHLKPVIKGPEKLLANNLIVQNGIFRFVDHEIKQLSYLLMNFRVSAVSDTKAESILTIALNEQTGTVPLKIWERLKGELENASDDLPDQRTSDIAGFLERGRDIAGRLALLEYQDFLKSLNRRLNRDVKRLQEYYGTITGEIEKTLRKKGVKKEDVDRGLSQLEATKIEYNKKISDARDRYALEILIEPINVLRIFMPAVVLRVDLQRRKNKMPVEIPLNPISNRLEHLICTGCHQPVLSFYLCDKMHLLCPSCYPDCRLCK